MVIPAYWTLHLVHDRAKDLSSQNCTYGDTSFYSGQTSYLSMNVLTFAKDEKIGFFKPLHANLSDGQKC